MSDAYAGCQNDDERRAFIQSAMEFTDDMPDGAALACLEESIGPKWLDELIRLGFAQETQ